MKKIITTVFVVSLISACGGGGGGSETCDYAVSAASNGATQETATSYWNCLDSRGIDWAFSLFDNGAGLEAISDQIIAVTWSESGCRAIHAVDAAGGAQVTKITGSVSSRVLTFTLTSDSTGEELTSSCTLVNL